MLISFIIPCYKSANTLESVVDNIENMMKGNIKTNGVVSSIFKLEDWEKAFDYATGKYGDFKVAFKFD